MCYLVNWNLAKVTNVFKDIVEEYSFDFAKNHAELQVFSPHTKKLPTFEGSEDQKSE